MNDTTIISLRVSKAILAKIKTDAEKVGLSAGVYIRTILYEKFQAQ